MKIIITTTTTIIIIILIITIIIKTSGNKKLGVATESMKVKLFSVWFGIYSLPPFIRLKCLRNVFCFVSF